MQRDRGISTHHGTCPPGLRAHQITSVNLASLGKLRMTVESYRITVSRGRTSTWHQPGKDSVPWPCHGRAEEQGHRALQFRAGVGPRCLAHCPAPRQHEIKTRLNFCQNHLLGYELWLHSERQRSAKPPLGLPPLRGHCFHLLLSERSNCSQGSSVWPALKVLPAAPGLQPGEQ